MAARLRRYVQRTLLLVLATAVALLALAREPAAAEPRATDLQVLEEMNRVRAAHGLPAFRLDSKLQRAADAHSRDMLRRDYFSHGNFFARMQRFGAPGPRTAENIAWCTNWRNPARTLVRMWLASPPHRANLLRRGFRRVGVAARTGRFLGSPATVATVDFAGL